MNKTITQKMNQIKETTTLLHKQYKELSKELEYTLNAELSMIRGHITISPQSQKDIILYIDFYHIEGGTQVYPSDLDEETIKQLADNVEKTLHQVGYKLDQEDYNELINREEVCIGCVHCGGYNELEYYVDLPGGEQA